MRYQSFLKRPVFIILWVTSEKQRRASHLKRRERPTSSLIPMWPSVSWAHGALLSHLWASVFSCPTWGDPFFLHVSSILYSLKILKPVVLKWVDRYTPITNLLQSDHWDKIKHVSGPHLVIIWDASIFVTDSEYSLTRQMND